MLPVALEPLLGALRQPAACCTSLHLRAGGGQRCSVRKNSP